MVLPLASGVRVSTRPRSRSRRGAVWRWARCMRRGTGAVRLTVQALQLTLLLSSLRSLLLLGSLRSLLLFGPLSLLLGSLLLLVSLSLSLLLLRLLGLLVRRKPLLRSAQPWLIWARLRGRSPGRLIRLSPRRGLYVARPLLLHILR